MEGVTEPTASVARKQASHLRLKLVFCRKASICKTLGGKEASVASAIETTLGNRSGGDIGVCGKEASVASAIETSKGKCSPNPLHYVARKQASHLRLKLAHAILREADLSGGKEASVASAIETRRDTTVALLFEDGGLSQSRKLSY
jgi:hypothetical protein